MTFYGKKSGLSSTIFAKYNNKKSIELSVLAMINKKTNKELVASVGKIGIRFHLSHSHVF